MFLHVVFLKSGTWCWNTRTSEGSSERYKTSRLITTCPFQVLKQQKVESKRQEEMASIIRSKLCTIPDTPKYRCIRRQLQDEWDFWLKPFPVRTCVWFFLRHELFWFCLVQVCTTQFCWFPPAFMANTSKIPNIQTRFSIFCEISQQMLPDHNLNLNQNGIVVQAHIVATCIGLYLCGSCRGFSFRPRPTFVLAPCAHTSLEFCPLELVADVGHVLAFTCTLSVCLDSYFV